MEKPRLTIALSMKNCDREKSWWKGTFMLDVETETRVPLSYNSKLEEVRGRYPKINTRLEVC